MARIFGLAGRDMTEFDYKGWKVSYDELEEPAIVEATKTTKRLMGLYRKTQVVKITFEHYVTPAEIEKAIREAINEEEMLSEQFKLLRGERPAT